MSNLTKEEKKLYKTLKAQAKATGVVFGFYKPWGVVAFFPTCRGNGYMVYSLCSKNDTWDKRRGKFEALKRWNGLGRYGLPCSMPKDKAEADEAAYEILNSVY